MSSAEPVRGYWRRECAFPTACLWAAVAAHVGAFAWQAATNFPTRNEVAHVPAGLSYLLTGRFDLYRVNPPLARLAQAAPVLLAGADADWLADLPDRPGHRAEWGAAAEFARRNSGRYVFLMTLARLPGLAWSLAGLLLVRRWSGELYGPRAALLASVLWCTGPNVVANAALATPDLPCAVLCLAAAYSFHRYLLAPSTPAACRCSVILGLAQLAKFTALADYLSLGLLAAAAWRSPARPYFRALPSRVKAAHAAAVAGLSLVVLNMGYGYEGTLTPLGEFDFVSDNTTVEISGARRNAFAGRWAGNIPVPLPADYVRGLDLQQADFEGRVPSYLRGELRPTGWWYFYFYAMLVKVPVGTLALGAAGLALSLAPQFRKFGELPVWLPAGVVLALASAKSGHTLHLRYVLPAMPFMLVGLSKVAALESGWCRLGVWLAVGYSVVSSLSVLPHSLAYFNEPAGGPSNGAAHLIDSNLDWGQDLLRLRAWADANPDARPLSIGYENFVDLSVAGLGGLAAAPSDPGALEPGWYAVDVQSMYVRDLRYFRGLTPVSRAGYSIHIYHVGTAEIAKLAQMRAASSVGR